MKVGDLVKTTIWGYGVVLDLRVLTLQHDPRGQVVIASVLVEKSISGTYVRRITGENLEVINESG